MNNHAKRVADFSYSLCKLLFRNHHKIACMYDVFVCVRGMLAIHSHTKQQTQTGHIYGTAGIVHWLMAVAEYKHKSIARAHRSYRHTRSEKEIDTHKAAKSNHPHLTNRQGCHFNLKKKKKKFRRLWYSIGYSRTRTVLWCVCVLLSHFGVPILLVFFLLPNRIVTSVIPECFIETAFWSR